MVHELNESSFPSAIASEPNFTIVWSRNEKKTFSTEKTIFMWSPHCRGNQKYILEREKKTSYINNVSNTSCLLKKGDEIYWQRVQQNLSQRGTTVLDIYQE
ncbi:hypothetical protein CEXT_95691 [Caerostris extrusa]|uniref:Uncharacterized protein n=1 Tax=Caerostris extrusa TaxID=172846 RepID=A0AAV4TMB0_CAEEX|nr:hypothetical protein CEXT_95691 [Caerostris extrusa]